MVVAESLLGEIKQLLSGSALPPLADLQIEFVKLSSVAEHWGTADVLRSINARIKVVMVTVIVQKPSSFITTMSRSF